jgi:hypothetical protein
MTSDLTTKTNGTEIEAVSAEEKPEGQLAARDGQPTTAQSSYGKGRAVDEIEGCCELSPRRAVLSGDELRQRLSVTLARHLQGEALNQFPKVIDIPVLNQERGFSSHEGVQIPFTVIASAGSEASVPDGTSGTVKFTQNFKILAQGTAANEHVPVVARFEPANTEAVCSAPGCPFCNPSNDSFFRF